MDLSTKARFRYYLVPLVAVGVEHRFEWGTAGGVVQDGEERPGEGAAERARKLSVCGRCDRGSRPSHASPRAKRPQACNCERRSNHQQGRESNHNQLLPRVVCIHGGQHQKHSWNADAEKRTQPSSPPKPRTETCGQGSYRCEDEHDKDVSGNVGRKARRRNWRARSG
jgi:hypothetical protein